MIDPFHTSLLLASKLLLTFPSTHHIRSASALGGLLKDHACSSGSGDGNSTYNRHTHQSLLVDFVVDQFPQALSLQIAGFDVQKIVVVPPGFSIVAKFVVPKGEIIETFSPTVWTLAEYVAEKPDPFLLIFTSCGFDQAL
jgi:hypothetical protein